VGTLVLAGAHSYFWRKCFFRTKLNAECECFFGEQVFSPSQKLKRIVASKNPVRKKAILVPFLSTKQLKSAAEKAFPVAHWRETQMLQASNRWGKSGKKQAIHLWLGA
jgi:hypothetical protein